MYDYKKIVSFDDNSNFNIGKINFFLNKNVIKYARLLKKITAVVVAVIEKYVVVSRLRLFYPSLPEGMDISRDLLKKWHHFP